MGKSLLHAFFLVGMIILLNNPRRWASAEAAGGVDDDDEQVLQTYIVHVKHPKDRHLVKHPDPMKVWYNSLLDDLPSVTKSTMTTSEPSPRIIHSYSHAMTGFAARFTKKELKAVSNTDWFVYAQPDRTYRLHTTHSPTFLGLPRPGGLWNRTNMGQGVIIGVVDTGVAIGHPSLNDDGMPAPPPRWNGTCKAPAVCNNKLIGAISVIPDQESPADDITAGHGTHTSTIAAGALVQDVSLYGNAMGDAIGIAPRAHLAVYKVSDNGGNIMASAIIAGIGAAVRDGCDIISVSLGATEWRPLYDEPIATGSFLAIHQGVFVSASAGNEGPSPGTLSNEMPWVLTVGATTTDRLIEARVKLGNGQEFVGESLYQPNGTQVLPLVYAGDNHANPDATYCGPRAFDGFDIKGKIVLCRRGGMINRPDKGKYIKLAGGAGMILMNELSTGSTIFADMHVLPTSHVAYADGDNILAYINSTTNPTATILLNGIVTGRTRAPVAASLSSRGPNRACPGILKPDIAGPGLDIIAASPAHVEPADFHANQTAPAFRMDSGTSMSCPHLSGIAALVKAAHPDWSPSAIKSAIMTTATMTDSTGGPILDQTNLPADVLTLGAGHVDVSRVDDPGLVYDTDHNDYTNFLCSLGYDDQEVQVVADHVFVNCSTTTKITEQELNYPSIAVTLGPVGSTNVTVKRTVTNVGVARSFYWAEVDAPVGVMVVVKPTRLRFDSLKQTQSFVVVFTRTSGGSSGYVQGQMKWVSDNHVVRSPMSIKLE